MPHVANPVSEATPLAAARQRHVDPEIQIETAAVGGAVQGRPGCARFVNKPKESGLLRPKIKSWAEGRICAWQAALERAMK